MTEGKKAIVSLVVSLALLVGTVYTLLPAEAAVKGDTPKGTHGAVAVATAASTKVFTGMIGRNAFAIYNNGPNTIWCGFSSVVTTATGFPVVSLGSLSIHVVYNGAGDKAFYCIASTALQVTPADTRWIQIK